MSLSKKLALTLISVAAVGCFFPYLLPPGKWEMHLGIDLCLCVAIVWVGVLVCCLLRFRKSGLWFLVGAPLALYCLSSRS
jgi:hypothetical protein